MLRNNEQTLFTDSVQQTNESIVLAGPTGTDADWVTSN